MFPFGGATSARRAASAPKNPLGVRGLPEMVDACVVRDYGCTREWPNGKAAVSDAVDCGFKSYLPCLGFCSLVEEHQSADLKTGVRFLPELDFAFGWGWSFCGFVVFAYWIFAIQKFFTVYV